MRKKNLLFLLILIVLIGVFLLFFIQTKNSENSKSSTGTIKNRIYTDKNLKIINAIKFKDVPYRLLPSEDSVLVMIDTSVLFFSLDLKKQIKVILPSETNNGNYYLYKSKNILAGLNVISKLVYVQKNGILKSNIYSGFYLNGIFCNDRFYFLKLVPQKKIGLLYFESWDYEKDLRKDALCLNSFLKDELVNYNECFESVLEGNFFRIDDEQFGFYFYRGGYFLIETKDSFKLMKTIVDYPFIRFHEKNGELPGGLNAVQCEPEKDIFVQYSACSDGNNIYILSNIIGENKKERCIDVYNVVNGNYVESFSVPNYKKSLPTEILIVHKYLIVVYDDGSLVSYFLNNK